MKNIQPIQIWKNGQNKTASILGAYIINDNLESSATFYWQLKEADSIVPDSDPEQVVSGAQLSEGNVTMSGEDYQNWDNSNDAAYQFIAEQINVTIIS